MLTRREYGQLLFGGKQYAGSSGGGGTTVSVRRGTLTADTTADEATGKISASIVIDGDTEPGLYTVDFQMKQGQRVVLLFFGGQALVLPISSVLLGLANDYADAGDAAVIEQSKQAAIEAAGDAITEEVNEQFDGLYDDYTAFKQTHALTDEQITSQISDVAEDAGQALEASSTAVQTVNSFQTTVNEKFTALDGDVLDMQSDIQQNAEAITTEVMNRQTAVNGALSEAKTYTDTTANGIQTSIANTYQTKEGMSSYATTAYVDSTSESIEQTFTLSLAEKGKTYVGKPSPPYHEGDVWIDAENGIAYTCTRDRLSGSYLSSDWTESDAFVSTIIRNSVNGVEVGKANSGYKTRLSAYSMDVFNESGNSVASYGSTARIGLESSNNIQVSSAGIDFCARNGSASVRVRQNVGTSYIEALGSASLNIGSFNDGTGNLILGSHSPAVLHNYDSTLKDNSNVFSSQSMGYLLGAARLYANASGTQGSFTLSVSASNYSLLEFVYGDGTRLMTKRIYNADGEVVSLDRIVHGAGVVYMGANVYSVSGTSVSLLTANSGQAFVDASGSCGVDQVPKLYVYQVIGWR